MDTSQSTTILFGNGLGMALDSEHFLLKTGMSKAWEQLPEDSKKRVLIALSEQKEMPDHENDLFHIQEILFSIDTLRKYEKDFEWLAADARTFKKIFQQYVVNVANHFFSFDGALPEEFTQPLCNFIEKTSPTPHIVTLNYDRLLYSALWEKNIFHGSYFETTLCDGMLNQGFDRENLKRKFDNSFGWYLHLHGSPLFYSKNSVILKDGIDTFPFSLHDKKRNHLVLTHYKYKPQVITKSYLLDTYWDYFNYALQESNRFIMFGYSGNDEHINILAREWKNKSPDSHLIEIIEYQNNISDEDGRIFWNKKFNNLLDFKKDKLIRLPSILNYTSWPKGAGD